MHCENTTSRATTNAAIASRVSIAARRKTLIGSVVVAMAATLAIASTAQAGQWAANHPRRVEVNNRLANQNNRIRREVQDRQMSRGEGGRAWCGLPQAAKSGPLAAELRSALKFDSHNNSSQGVAAGRAVRRQRSWKALSTGSGAPPLATERYPASTTAIACSASRNPATGGQPFARSAQLRFKNTE
ncbi:hypothetical protein F6X37_22710 [Paraburkholderia sp. 31.1]|nr:hypothetical protein [Paraburkholderia sp. 31.1]